MKQIILSCIILAGGLSSCSVQADYTQLLEAEALKAGLNPSLLKAIAAVESSNNPRAVNRKTGDYGLMQINKHNLKAFGVTEHSAMHVQTNIKLAVKLLKQYKRRFGHERMWACRYNLGTGRRVPYWDSCKIYYAKLRKAGYYQPNVGEIAQAD